MPQDVVLELPWPLRTSPHVDQARTQTMEWMEKWGLYDGQSSTPAHFTSWRLAELAGYFYPDATPEGLKLASDLMGWYFAPFDDLFDGELGNDPQAVVWICAELSTLSRSTSPVAAALADIWRRSCCGMSEAWCTRARANWQSYLAAHVAETVNRHHRRTLTAQECVSQRSLSTSCHVVIDLIERVNGYELPSMVWYNPVLAELRALAAEIVGMSNDLCSVEKEEHIGTSDNVILVLERERCCNRDSAIELVRQMTADRIDRFLNLEQRIPDLDCILATEQRFVLRHFVGGLHAIIRGDNEWERTSGRYAVE